MNIGLYKKFTFKDLTNQQVVNMINKELPIKIKDEYLIDRVHMRYPLLSKSEISIIVKSVFESMRDLMILGKVLYFDDLFQGVKFIFYSNRKYKKLKDITIAKLRVHANIARKLRK